jgi:hypothetical protein
MHMEFVLLYRKQFDTFNSPEPFVMFESLNSYCRHLMIQMLHPSCQLHMVPTCLSLVLLLTKYVL